MKCMIHKQKISWN